MPLVLRPDAMIPSVIALPTLPRCAGVRYPFSVSALAGIATYGHVANHQKECATGMRYRNALQERATGTRYRNGRQDNVQTV
jgi:hypothetical protein